MNNILIIGTKNKAKIDQIKSALKSLSVNVQGLPDIEFSEVVEDGKTALENSCKKAAYYSSAIGQPVLSTDNALYFDSLSDDKQPGLNVRRIEGRVDRPTDKELLVYYSDFIKKLGNNMNGYWEFGICLAKPSGELLKKIVKSPRIFVSEPSKKVIPGYPLDSIQINPKTGKYISEMSQAETDAFWQETIGTELCDFIKTSDIY